MLQVLGYGGGQNACRLTAANKPRTISKRWIARPSPRPSLALLAAKAVEALQAEGG